MPIKVNWDAWYREERRRDIRLYLLVGTILLSLVGAVIWMASYLPSCRCICS